MRGRDQGRQGLEGEVQDVGLLVVLALVLNHLFLINYY